MERWNKIFFPNLIEILGEGFIFCSGYKVPLKNVLLTTAWCVESWVPIPDPVHGWLGSMHDSTDRARFCHISTRGDGLGGFVPAPARVARISWTSDPTRGEWGTFAAVEDNLVPAATPCIRLIRDCKEDHKTTFWHHISNTISKECLSERQKDQNVEVNLFVGQRMGALAFKAML